MSKDIKGTVLNGRYTILERIGAGGMAAVYRAQDKIGGGFVAVKILSREFLERNQRERERNLRRFKREAEILRRLNGSPHVVGFVEHACSGDSDWFIAMELLEGEQLRSYIGRGRAAMGLATFLHYGIHLIDGVKEIHSKQIIHRDLAPDNVILVKNAKGILIPKFLDFGIGKSIGDELDQVTQMLTIMGKPQYFSPEQARGAELGSASDVYALGVLLYEMATGKVPLDVRGIPDFKKIQSEPPTPIENFSGGRRLPIELQRIIMCCLAKSAEERPLIDELRDTLTSVRTKFESGEIFEVDPDTAPTLDQTSPISIQEIELQEGDNVSRYQIKNIIGRGGMGAVYLAWDPVLHRDIAIKVATRVSEEKAKQALLREARASSALRCENIVTIYDAGTDEGTPYIAMEYVKGDTLGERIASKGPLSLEDFWPAAKGIVNGLIVAHDRETPVIHRDLKPANMLVHRHGVKITDFGIAKVSGQLPVSPSGETGVTSLAEGTVATMSPEQANGRDVDARSDLYSLGCVFYMMLTGRPPFTGNQIAILYQHSTSEPTPPSSHISEIPPALDAIVLRLLQKDPELRYASATEVLKDLSLHFEPGRAVTGPWWQSPMAKAAMLVLIVGAAAWFTRQSWLPFANEPTPIILKNAFTGAVIGPADVLTKVKRVDVVVNAEPGTLIVCKTTPLGVGDATDDTMAVTQSFSVNEQPFTLKIDLPVPDDLDTNQLKRFRVLVQRESRSGRAESQAVFQASYDCEDPKIFFKTHNRSEWIEATQSNIPRLSDSSLSWQVVDRQSGLPMSASDPIESWSTESGSEKPKGLNIESLGSDSWKISAMDCSGRTVERRFTEKTITPELRFEQPSLVTSTDELEVRLRLVAPPFNFVEDPLKPGSLRGFFNSASGADFVFEQIEESDEFQAEIQLPSSEGMTAESFPLQFSYAGEAIPGQHLDILLDQTPPLISANLHEARGTRTVKAQDPATATSITIQKKTSLDAALSFHVSDGDAGSFEGAVEYRVNEGTWFPLQARDDNLYRIPASAAKGSAFGLSVRARDTAGNVRALALAVNVVSTSVASISIDGNPAKFGTLWAAANTPQKLELRAEDLPAGKEIALRVRNGANSFTSDLIRLKQDAGTWVSQGVSFGLDPTGESTREVLIYLVPKLKSSKEPALEIASFKVSLDNEAPRLDTKIGDEIASWGTTLSVGSFPPLTIEVTDTSPLDNREETLDIVPVVSGQPEVRKSIQVTKNGLRVSIISAQNELTKPAEWNISYATRDAAGNKTTPVKTRLRVTPPRFVILNSTGRQIPSESPDTPFTLYTKKRTLSLSLRNQSGAGTWRLLARQGTPGNLGEAKGLDATLSSDRASQFDIPLQGDGQGRLEILAQELVQGHPLPSRRIVVIDWNFDAEAPAWKVYKGNVEEAGTPEELANRILYVSKLSEIRIRAKDVSGIEALSPVAKRSLPTLSRTSDQSGASWQFDAEAPGWGSRSISFDIHDRAGNSSRVSLQLVEAATEPRLTSVSIAGSTLAPVEQPAVYISPTKSVSVGVENRTDSIRGVLPEIFDSQGKKKTLGVSEFEGSMTIPIEFPSGGEFTVNLLTIDKHGRPGDKPFATFKLHIDLTPPSIEIVLNQPKPSTRFHGATVRVNGSEDWLEVRSGIEANNLPVASVRPATPVGSNQYEIAGWQLLPPGPYNLVVTARDRAGNQTTVKQAFRISSEVVATPSTEVKARVFNRREIQRRTGLTPRLISIPGRKRELWVSQTEVTVATWKKFYKAYMAENVDEGFLKRLRAEKLTTYSLVHIQLKNEKHIEDAHQAIIQDPDDFPARYLSHELAVALAFWAGGRLPTADEWRLAAGRAVIPNADWPVYNDEGEMKSSSEFLIRLPQWARVRVSTTRVRESGPLPIPELGQGSPFGLLGIPGNLAEWVSDPKIGMNSVGVMGGSFRFPWDHRSRGAQLGRSLTKPEPGKATNRSDIGMRVVWEK